MDPKGDLAMKIAFAIIVVLFSINVARAEACLSAATMAFLLAAIGEEPVLADAKKGYIVALDKDTGSWSLIRVKEDGDVCLVLSGNDMRIVK